MFFDRENFIDIYQQKLEFFTSKKWQNTYHLAFLGLRRTGKTTLIQQLFEYYSKGQLTFYFDFSALATTPLNFSRELIFALFSKIDGNMYIDLDELRINQTQPELLEAVKNYQKVITTGNEYKIIDVTFSMITLLSKYHNMIIAFDEFQELLNFRNFRDLKQIDALFRSHLLNQTKVFYLISGSYPEIIKDLILNPHNMLYSHFEIYEIGNFDQKTSRAYTKYLSPHLDNKTIRTIYTATNGNPYLISLLGAKITNTTDLETLMKTELFNTKGQIYNHFLYILESSIGKIGKTATLNAILKDIAVSGEGKLTALAEKFGLSPQLISKEVQKLKKISILYQDAEKTIKFRDYLFRFFCYYYFNGYGVYEIDATKFYLDKVEELTNKVAQVSMELGGAKEFELYYEVKEYQGKERRGIKLPQFKILQKNYLTETGDEIDLYAETPRGKKRIFELKYKEKQIGDKEIEKLLNKLKADQYVMISKVGFSQNVSKKYRNREDLSLIQL